MDILADYNDDDGPEITKTTASSRMIMNMITVKSSSVTQFGTYLNYS